MRRITVGNLRDVAESRGFEVSKQGWHEACACLGFGCPALPTNTQPCLDERSDQPRPDRALMIGDIPFGGTSAIVGNVVRIVRRQRAQAERRQQRPLDEIDDTSDRKSVV